MPVSLRKYYKRSRKLILTRYKKLKDENKQACDLMLHYSDLRLAHRMKSGFMISARWKRIVSSRGNLMTGLRMRRGCGIKEFEACAKTTGPGERNPECL